MTSQFVPRPPIQGELGIRPAQRLKTSVIWPAVLLFYASLLPLEAKIDLGNLRIYAFRISLFICFPWIIQKLLSGRIRLGPVDVMLILASIWMAVAMSMTEGFSRGMESGGVQGFDLFTSYMVGRCALQTPGAFARLFKFALPGLIIVGLSMMFESVARQLFVRPLFASIFGGIASEAGQIFLEQRLGFLRAYGPFPHPILAGLHMACFLPIYSLAIRNRWVRVGGIAASLLGLFSISSASFMAFVVNSLLVLYDRLQLKVRQLSWKALLVALAFPLLLIQIYSQNGLLSVVVRYLTLNPATGSYRMLVWNETMDDVAASPLFGIGFHEWTRPIWMISSSIDNHWLLMTVRFGIPEALLLAMATILTIFRISMAAGKAPKQVRDLLVGLAITLSVMALLMFTVSLWGNTFAWFALLLGAAAGLDRPRMRGPVR